MFYLNRIFENRALFTSKEQDENLPDSDARAHINGTQHKTCVTIRVNGTVPQWSRNLSCEEAVVDGGGGGEDQEKVEEGGGFDDPRDVDLEEERLGAMRLFDEPGGEGGGAEVTVGSEHTVWSREELAGPSSEKDLLMTSSSRKIIIQNIPPLTKPSELRDAMHRIGDLEHVKVYHPSKFEADIAPPPENIALLNKGVKKFSQVKKVRTGFSILSVNHLEVASPFDGVCVL